jgi:hypothetical protein
MAREGKGFDRNEVGKILRSVEKSAPDQVVLFTVRNAVRMLQFLVLEEGLDRWIVDGIDYRGKYLVTIWQAIAITYTLPSYKGSVKDLPLLAVVDNLKRAEKLMGNTVTGVVQLAFKSATAKNHVDLVVNALHSMRQIEQIAMLDENLSNILIDTVRADIALLRFGKDLLSLKIFQGEMRSDIYKYERQWNEELKYLIGFYSTNGYGSLSQHILKITNDYEYLKRGEVYRDELYKWLKVSGKEIDKLAVAYNGEKEKPRTNYVPSSMLREDSQGEDALNREELARALAKIISSSKVDHMTIGLLGDWGSGKSFLLNLTKKRLNQERQGIQFICGEFNAWRYENSENIQAGIAQEAVSALTKDLNFCKKQRLTLNFAWKIHKGRFLISLALLLIAVISLIVSSYLDFYTDSWSWLAGILAVFGFSGLAGFSVLLKGVVAHPMAKELRTYLKLPTYGADLGKIPVMQKHLKALSSLRLGKGCLFKEKNKELRLLYVVDDLDRCGPDGIVKTLEGIRLMLDIPHVIVIIAIDPRIALAALATHYEKIAKHHVGRSELAIARDYLGKIVHLPISLSQPDQDTVAAYVEYLFGAEEYVKDSSADAALPKESKVADETNSMRTKSESSPSSSSSKKTEPGETPKSEQIEAPRTQQEARTLTGMSPQHQAAFQHWVKAFEMHNPRQIKRLYNSYNLMRHYYGEENPSVMKGIYPYPRMVGLILLEWINEKPSGERHQYKVALWGGGDQPRKNDAEGLIFSNAREVVSPEVLKREVMPFVLPAVENKAVDDKENAINVKSGNST